MIGLAALAAAGAAFLLSASVGLGGSLILVPALSLLLGTKQGVALAALLLAANNVWKVGAYRETIPWRRSIVVLALTMIGAWLGARALVSVSDRTVSVAVVLAIAATLLIESSRRRHNVGRVAAPGLAFLSGATSGFSGTSGPLKGVAIRSLGFDRLHFVGAASLVSLGGDAVKTATYSETGLLDAGSWALAAAALPVMAGCTLLGRRLNERWGERAFFGLFWAVMGGYVARLLLRF